MLLVLRISNWRIDIIMIIDALTHWLTDSLTHWPSIEANKTGQFLWLKKTWLS